MKTDRSWDPNFSSRISAVSGWRAVVALLIRPNFRKSAFFRGFCALAITRPLPPQIRPPQNPGPGNCGKMVSEGRKLGNLGGVRRVRAEAPPPPHAQALRSCAPVNIEHKNSIYILNPCRPPPFHRPHTYLYSSLPSSRFTVLCLPTPTTLSWAPASPWRCLAFSTRSPRTRTRSSSSTSMVRATWCTTRILARKLSGAWRCGSCVRGVGT